MPSSDTSSGDESASSTLANLAGCSKASPTVKVLSCDSLLPLQEGVAVPDVIPGIAKVHELIGKGEFHTVHRGSMPGHGDVAVKTFSLGVSVRKVISDLRKLRHPNIVNVLDVIPAQRLSIILELSGRSLHEALHGATDTRHPEIGNVEKRLEIAYRIISAVAFLHKNDILHRNIGSCHCFESLQARSLSFKLGEFMLARSVSGAVMTTWTGNFAYMAPEVMDDNKYGHPSDVFSCGILIHETVCRKVPYGGSSSPRLVMQVMGGHRPSLDDLPDLPGGRGCRREHLASLIGLAWAAQPAERPSADNVNVILRSLLAEEQLNK